MLHIYQHSEETLAYLGMDSHNKNVISILLAFKRVGWEMKDKNPKQKPEKRFVEKRPKNPHPLRPPNK